MKPLTENAQQKNSDLHIYFVSQEIAYKTQSELATCQPVSKDCVTKLSRKYVSSLINLTYRLSS